MFRFAFTKQNIEYFVDYLFFFYNFRVDTLNLPMRKENARHSNRRQINRTVPGPSFAIPYPLIWMAHFPKSNESTTTASTDLCMEQSKRGAPFFIWKIHAYNFSSGSWFDKEKKIAQRRITIFTLYFGKLKHAFDFPSALVSRHYSDYWCQWMI